MGAVPGGSSLLEGSWQFEKLWRVKLDHLQSGQTGITNKAWSHLVLLSQPFPDFPISK
jgi:hypothetical protein